MTLTPAYGRDYKSAKAVKADWEADKDFIIADFMDPYEGKPVNRQQLRENGTSPGTVVKIRYGQLRKVTVLAVGPR